MQPNINGSRSIWLCDNDEEDQLFFEMALEKVDSAAQLTSFYNSTELMLQLQRTAPDLLFLDISIPHVNGTECLKAIRENPALQRLPVIMYSDSDFSKIVNACYGYGAALYLIKPTNFDTLVGQLNQLLELNWYDWENITERQFTSNQYLPFGV